MAGALRPAVLLIFFASLLFLLDAVLDGVQPLGEHWSLEAYSNLGWTSYLFAVVNLIVGVLIARGSERSLALRIGLSGFFLVERPVSAFLIGQKPIESIGVHLVTAFIELVILVTTIRVWRLGHSVRGSDLHALFALEAEPMAASMAAPRSEPIEVADLELAANPEAAVAEPEPAAAEPPPAGVEPEPAAAEPEPAAAEGASMAAAPLPVLEPGAAAADEGLAPPPPAWLLGILALLLAATLVADAIAAGLVPGSEIDLAAPGWLVYVFALVILTVAARAVHGRRVALRMLLVLSLIFFVERAFSPFALRLLDPIALGLHLVAAFVALALALATASAIRIRRARLPAAQTS